MRWSRRRHGRARRQLRRVVEQFVQSKTDADYTWKTKLEKIASLEAFCTRLRRDIRAGLGLKWLPAKLKQRLLGFTTL